MSALHITPVTLPASCQQLRGEVRDFLAEHMPAIPARVRARNWSAADESFSRLLGDRGWIGMCWPKQYGGQQRSALERYVLIEELLAAGAPVGGHWIGDRQSGPLLLRWGAERYRKELLPRIAQGECWFCIGMSEADTGSDLASLRTKAQHSSDGWVINGSKLWTSFAHRAEYMIALVRTALPSESRHDGLTQLLIKLDTPGITIRPIPNMAGDEDFNEVVFDNVEIPADCLIGTEGEGWAQVNAELAYERSGPERYLSANALFSEISRGADSDNENHAVQIGRLVASCVTLRQMSLGLAGMLARGENPALPASLVKDQGALLEQSIAQHAHDLFGADALDSRTYLGQLMQSAVQVQPSFSLRGGTREILRGMIARGLGLR
jgi:acyl-CoA dehydrogenase